MFWSGGSVTMLHKLKHENGDIAAVEDFDLQFMLNKGYVYMTDDEVNKHESVPESEFHTEWDGKTWIDTRTPEESLEYTRTQMPTLSKREFRKRLRDENLFEQVDAYVKASNDGYLQDAWEYADYFTRLDPFIIQASSDIGLTPERVDQIWVKAS